MKKKFIKLFTMIFAVALLLTGCATVSDIFDENGQPYYYEEVEYFGGQVAQIGSHLYFANGYSDSSADDFDYSTASQTGYLARINLGQSFTFDEEATDTNNSSPLGSEKVSDRFVGYQNQNMFAYGSYLYFTSTNTHRTDELQNDYSRVTLLRVKFNGDGLQEIYTTRFDDNSQISVQKGSDGNYYYVICAQNSEEEYQLSSIRIGDSLGENTILAENIESYAIADANSSFKNVVFTTTNDDGEIEIKAVDFANGQITDYSYPQSSEITLLDRVGDVVFYSVDTDISDVEIYQKNITQSNNFDATGRFYSDDSISNVMATEDGFAFITENGSLVYKTLNGTSKVLISSDTTFDVLFEENGWIYYSTSTQINRIGVLSGETQNVVTMTSIISGTYGISDGYIYFFAQIEQTDSESSDTEEVDENYYLYRAPLSGNGAYQLIGRSL